MGVFLPGCSNVAERTWLLFHLPAFFCTGPETMETQSKSNEYLNLFSGEHGPKL